MKIKEKLAKLKHLNNLRPKLTHQQLLEVSIITLILTLAFTIRILPMRWGYYLSEFDPYFQYRLTEHIYKNGPFAWITWHDYQRWYPEGVDVGKTAFPGLPLFAAFMYWIYNALAGSYGVSLYDFVVLLPAIMGTLTILMIYFLGKDFGGKSVGILSAFFFALNPSSISRMSLGFFDDESLSIPLLLLFLLAFLRSIDKDRKQNPAIGYAILSGFLMGYLTITWGATLYVIAITTIFVLVLVLLKRYHRRVFFSYSITFSLTLLFGASIPKLGIKFLTSASILPVFVVFALLCLAEVLTHIKSRKQKAIITCGFVLAGMIILIFVSSFITPIGGKFLAVINPFERLIHPIVESVQEHRPSTWTTFYMDFSLLVLFFPIGIYLSIMKLTNRNLMILIYALTSLYFASSFVRLIILLAPAFILLACLGLYTLINSFTVVLKQSVPKFGKKVNRSVVGKEFSATFLILIFLLLTYTTVIAKIPGSDMSYTFSQAYTPVTLMSSSIPIQVDKPILEWYEALIWMKYHLPNNAIVASWWDYGYWITVIANKTTLSDNGTLDTDKIAKIGKMFLSNETEAMKTLEEFNVGYVVVFSTWQQDGQPAGYGEESKWVWMARIAQLNESDYGAVNEQSKVWEWSDLGKNSTLYKMMYYGRDLKVMKTQLQLVLEKFSLVYISEGNNYGGIIPLVAVYKVLEEN